MTAASSATTQQELLVPSLARLHIRDNHHKRQTSSGLAQSTRPDAPRRSTDPPPSSPHQPSQDYPARTRSPLSRGHSRSQSAQSLSAPPMARSRSVPTVAFSHWSGSMSTSPVRPSSPLRPPPSRITPRRSLEETRPASSSGAGFLEIESIAEDAEVDFTSPPIIPSSALPANSVSFQRSNSGRRRPVSPLHQQSTLSSTETLPSSPPSGSTPRFNEPFPSSAISAASSMPSTPTSFRSRSPSIASLDTIEDSPDAEEEAAEEFAIAKLKAAADAAEAAEAEAQTERKLLAAGVQAPTIAQPAAWSPQSLKEKRKRWSVCGAERRGDFEMETIWED